MPEIRNPYQQGMVALWGLIGLFSIPVIIALPMVAFGKWGSVILIPVSSPFLLFCLVQGVVWLMGQTQVKQIQDFLASDRPLLRWTYTQAEWEAIKSGQWEETKGDWKLALGCLTSIFGLVGLLVGILGMASGEINPFVSTGVGVILGGLIGGVVAGGNYLAARREYLQSDPCQVVLAPTEFFYNGQYFRADGDDSRIERVEYKRGNPSQLILGTYYHPWWMRAREEGEWVIIVPRRVEEQVEAVMQSIRVSQEDADDDG
jgi:hypothetical protein